MATIHYVSTVYILLARLSGKSMNAWLSKTVNGSFTTKQNNTFRLNFPPLYHMIRMIFIFPMLDVDHFNVHKFCYYSFPMIGYSYCFVEEKEKKNTEQVCASYTHTSPNSVQT